MTITVFSLCPTISDKLQVSVCLFLVLSREEAPLQHAPPVMLALTQSPHLASLSTQPWALCSGSNSLGLTRKSMTCSNCLGAKQTNNHLPQEQTSKWIFWLFVPRIQKFTRGAQNKEIVPIFHPVGGCDSALQQTFYRVLGNEKQLYHHLLPTCTQIKQNVQLGTYILQIGHYSVIGALLKNNCQMLKV